MTVDPDRAKTLVLIASGLADPAERAAYIDRECGGDAELRARVDALLKAHDQSVNVGDHSGSQFTATYISDAPTDEDETSHRQQPKPVDSSKARSSHLVVSDRYGPQAEPAVVIAGRFTLVEKIGEGGMGEVWVANQTEPVKRQVALKLIKTGMDSKVVLQRFEQERQALALMDHPNIARVLDAGMTGEGDGKDEGGRVKGEAVEGISSSSFRLPLSSFRQRSFRPGQPFFVMELVSGLPLNKFCDEARLSLSQRLELFVPICQAVQHAHQKGIVHRDLKPANILVTMIDGRPVPKVIDFGVAKATSGKLTEETMFTGFGAVVGTLEYMSPEQAGGGEDIDTRSDIYSLGVILYEMLTGLRPIDAKRLKTAALTEMIRIIREEEPSKPSTRLSSDVSLPSLAAVRQTEPKQLMALLRGELDWVVMKCLEKQRELRYETANALARDIQRYLAHEMVEARPPSAGYRLRKLVQRKPLELALAAAMLVLALGAGMVAWWQNTQSVARRETDLRRQLEDQQRAAVESDRLARNAAAVASLLDQCQEALRANDAAQAKVVLEAAQKRSAEGGAEQEADRIARLAADLALLRDLDAVDQFAWTIITNKLPDWAVAAMHTRDALRGYGVDPDTVSVDAAVARITVSEVRGRIVSALDRLLRHQNSAGVREVLKRVDANPFRDAVRDAIFLNDTPTLAALVADFADSSDDAIERQSPGFAAFLGESSQIGVELRRKLLRTAVIRQPGDLGLLMTLGNTYPANRKEGVNDRLRWLQAAVAAAPDSAAAYSNLGVALNDSGQVDDAIACYKKSIELDPKFPLAHSNLGVVLKKKGRVDEAIGEYKKAIELDSKDADAHCSLGAILCDVKGDYDGAIVCFRKAIAIDPKFAKAHTNLGNALRDKGQVDEALASYRKAIEVDPKFAAAHAKLGEQLALQGQADQAIACFRKALALDPNVDSVHYNLGVALMGKGQLDEAIACYRQAIELDPKAAHAHTNLGNALASQGRVDLAIDCYRKAIEIDPRNANAYNGMGSILCDVKGDYDGAIACFRKALELRPKIALSHYNLGVALVGKGQLDEAIACYRKAIELEPFPAAYANLGQSLLVKGRLDEAIANFHKALELAPQFAPAQRSLAKAERLASSRDKFAAFQNGTGTPVNAEERLASIEWCRYKKLHQTAASLFAAAFAADPKLADDLDTGNRYNAACHSALAAAGQGAHAAQLDATERTRLRRQALDWLRADLALHTKQLESDKPAERDAARESLQHWRQDPDLASLREAADLAKLSAEEQALCTQFWADVAKLVEKAGE